MIVQYTHAVSPSDILAHVDCEDVPSEAIDKVVGSLHCNHFNDRRQ